MGAIWAILKPVAVALEGWAISFGLDALTKWVKEKLGPADKKPSAQQAQTEEVVLPAGTRASDQNLK